MFCSISVSDITYFNFSSLWIKVAYLVEKGQLIEAQLQAEKKRTQRLQGKIAGLLSKLEEKDMLCETSTKLLDSFKGTYNSTVRQMHGTQDLVVQHYMLILYSASI